MSTVAGELLAKIDAGVLGRALLEAAGGAGIGVTVTLVDSPVPRHVYVSDAAAELLGWPVDELLAGDPMDHIASRDQRRIRDRLALRSGGEQGQASYELCTVRKDGREVALEVTASHATLEGRRAVVAFLVDASARREAEAQKRGYEARFRELIESAPEPIGIIRGGHFVYVNPAYLTVLGYPDATSLYAVPLSSLLDQEQAILRAQREATVIEQRTPLGAQLYRVRRFDGATVLLEISSVYFEYEGKPSVLGMARDVTTRKQLEQQLVQSDRLAALGTMAAGVAHEVNNPLAYLMLNLEWIARKLPSVTKDPSSLPGLTAMLDEARHGAQRVSTIVRELRSFSRADGETRTRVDLAEVVRSGVKIAGHEIRHKARIVTSFEPARGVWANEARLEQVVINLLLNAVQALPEASVEHNEIRVSVRSDSDDRAVLEVFDNGEGIPADVLPRIFDPFFTTKPVGVGTGLGLSICHGIVTSLGGHIGAYSEPGEGTTFRVVLPTTDTLVGESPPMEGEAPSSRHTRRARVLVVDDELPIANTLRELLAPEHEVIAATTAAEAFEAIGQSDFDVVFCDLIMPGAGGIDLYERLRARHPGMERRLVFMTGGAFTERTAEFLAQVENRRVEKPFSLGLVEQIVREMAGTGAVLAAEGGKVLR
ncbi:MAG TPA: ATP-binding protein [Polyangiaceae bacterium]|jgi:PAS domain S-box-containing protein